MNKKTLIFSILASNAFGQSYAPAPGEPGSTAIYKDSSVFVSWASGVVLTRGPMNVQNTSAGQASFGLPEDALGNADGTVVVSLGDGGTATLTFNTPVENGEGPDFVVFENGFADHYMELAFVEVSSDGQNFYRFNAVSETPVDVQLSNFDFSDCRYVNNLAGKYRANYGTPFDLQELDGTPGLDIGSITHIRIIDVIGSIDPAYGTTDSQGTIINDPFPTEFSSGGFDLDAVGVIHQQQVRLETNTLNTSIYPNPTNGIFFVESEEPINITLLTTDGKLIFHEIIIGKKEVDIRFFDNGVYLLETTRNNVKEIMKIVKNG